MKRSAKYCLRRERGGSKHSTCIAIFGFNHERAIVKLTADHCIVHELLAVWVSAPPNPRESPKNINTLFAFAGYILQMRNASHLRIQEDSEEFHSVQTGDDLIIIPDIHDRNGSATCESYYAAFRW
ncbi:uncharacterized protein [Choristoneura fumiferana]|uniref:uncharacterized protein n=1 Tax=Choristoneura fumiferana TaxID=7141 RepID=UPI003D15749D